MDRTEVMRVEYEQQYEQYRWIGRQQTLVFTFYAAIVAATFALISAFSKEGVVLQSQPWWFLVILFFLGIVGIGISAALIKSRGMQFRTTIYLLELLIQMTEESTTTSTSVPALRFRRVPTSGGEFMPRDTATIAISLAFVFGIALIFGALAILLTTKFCVDQFLASIYWLASVIVVALIGIQYVLPKMLEEENDRARDDHEQSKVVTNWTDDLRKRSKLR